MEISDKNNRLIHAPLTVVEDGKLVEKILPITDYPPSITFPRLSGPPGMLSGIPAQQMGFTHLVNHAMASERAAKHGIKVMKLGTTYNSPAFFQLLAKIAHGMIVVNYEMDQITPLLTNIIIEADMKDVPNLIGTTGPIRGSSLHEVDARTGINEIACSIVEGPDKTKHLAVVDICLFAYIPGAKLAVPTYRVVAGTGTQIPRHSRWVRSLAQGESR